MLLALLKGGSESVDRAGSSTFCVVQPLDLMASMTRGDTQPPTRIIPAARVQCPMQRWRVSVAKIRLELWMN